MTDIFDKKKRSEIMSSVKSKDTQPELIVRRILRSMGYGYRLHRKDLPGTPDIVLTKYKKVIFVHGCFWHGHEGCSRAKLPQTNRKFWQEKIEKNILRDQKAFQDLRSLGWTSLIIWTCEIRDEEKLKEKITNFLLEDRIGRNDY
ncbi:DNA mismatch endonuclease Vsr [Methanofollis formosanus]|uniref:DNA mismatch endonuclease Vsr n=1 Tax=Methanofollis formosanus TaxID=299308 RepID=A0A8G1EFN1_9EURY|nr:very short patch repair endonuclease [Methanofollis formosanus]QYZ78900.1 DNA mismatch endonuclease Vsr [Methanofollis formosanus]